MKNQKFKIGYSYDDLTIVPSEISYIKSRSECKPFINIDGSDYLPIFTAPMSAVINSPSNCLAWSNEKIIPILPRTVDFSLRVSEMKNGTWVAFSLKEFQDVFCIIDSFDSPKIKSPQPTFRVCIDVANGHMKQIYDAVKKAKDIAKESSNYKLEIMAGNIANPKTYEYLCENCVPVDYIRLNIGGGAGCLTTSNVGVHYPIASLINECYKISCHYINAPKIIADGGIRNYSDVIKALALGADYVMIGSLFGGLLESAAPICFSEKDIEQMDQDGFYLQMYSQTHLNHADSDSVYYRLSIKDKTHKSYLGGLITKTVEKTIYYLFYPYQYCDTSYCLEQQQLKAKGFLNMLKPYHPYKEFYGMSTKKAQNLIDNATYHINLDENTIIKHKTSEGCQKNLPVTQTIQQWSNNMIDYLKSAMSYTDKRFIKDFIGNVELIINSPMEIQRINR